MLNVYRPRMNYNMKVMFSVYLYVYRVGGKRLPKPLVPDLLGREYPLIFCHWSCQNSCSMSSWGHPSQVLAKGQERGVSSQVLGKGYPLSLSRTPPPPPPPPPGWEGVVQLGPMTRVPLFPPLLGQHTSQT